MAESKIYLGDTNIEAFYNGSSSVSLYLGDEKLYPLGFQGKLKGIISGGTPYIVDCNDSTILTSTETSYQKSSMLSYEIGKCVETIGANAFSGSKNKLTSFTMSDSVKYIEDNCIIGMENLNVLKLSENIETIGNNGLNSFTVYGTPNLVLNFPKLRSAGNYFLWWINTNSTLSVTVTIGENITSIGQYFLNYDSMYTRPQKVDLTINAIIPPTLGNYAFTNLGSKLNIYVPSEAVDAYKAASGWSTFADRIQPIT